MYLVLRILQTSLRLSLSFGVIMSKYEWKSKSTRRHDVNLRIKRIKIHIHKEDLDAMGAMDVEYQKLLFNTCNDDLVYNLAFRNVTESMIEEGQRLILEWYGKQPHLPQNALEMDVLYRFYEGSGFSVEKVKKKIDSYFSMRSIFPEILCNRDPFSPDILMVLNCFQYAIIPQLTPERHRIIICKSLTSDTNVYSLLSCFKYTSMIGDLRMKYDVRNADHIIMDMEHLSLGHVLKTSPSLAKKCIYIIQNCYPIKMEGIHILNCPGYAVNLFNFAKSTLKKKIADRMHFHSSLEELHKFIPAKILPIEYGGQNSTCKELSDQVFKVLQSDLWKQRFLDSDNFKSDESKRLEKSDDKCGDLLGIMGTFRKLEID